MASYFMRIIEKHTKGGIKGWLGLAGYAAIIGTHAYMLYTGTLPSEQVKPHAIINLAAIVAIFIEHYY